MDKLVASPTEAVADIFSGATVASGGFGICGVPTALIEAVRELGVGNLRVVSNNCGIDHFGLGVLLESGQVSGVIASYIGENEEFARLYLSGELEVELTPQGTLAERLRAGGCGIPAFFTPTGIGTQVADGGLPRRYGKDGSVAIASPPKETREFGGRTYVLEEAIVCDFALVHAYRADRFGNLTFRAAARNFNPLCAMSAKVTIVQAEHVLEAGEIPPEEVHLPGVFVQRVVPLPATFEKRIERRTVRERSA